MYFARSDRTRPVYHQVLPRIRFGLDEESVTCGSDGVIDLYSSAIKIFALLRRNNVFTGSDNVFEHIQVRQMHLVSDPREKENVHPIVPNQALSMVQSITPYTYTINNAGTSAGLMADTIPPEYTHTSRSGIRTVDYNALFAHLWAAVQQLAGEVEELRATRGTWQPDDTTSPPCPTTRTRRQRRASI